MLDTGIKAFTMRFCLRYKKYLLSRTKELKQSTAKNGTSDQREAKAIPTTSFIHLRVHSLTLIICETDDSNGKSDQGFSNALLSCFAVFSAKRVSKQICSSMINSLSIGDTVRK